MRLDELKWPPNETDNWRWVDNVVPGWTIYQSLDNSDHCRAGNYMIARPDQTYTGDMEYQDLEPIAAQAILYHLLAEVTPEGNKCE